MPDGVDPVDAETAIVNGLTAWRMLHRTARVQPGATIVVLGAAGGVGSLLVQLAVDAGIRVIGVAGTRQQDSVRALGAIPVDYRADDVPARVRELAPDGVAAVFDHVGGDGIEASWRMLARGGTLVSYGSAATKDDPGNARLPVLKLLARLTAWNLLPNGRHAHFFNLWAGKRLRPARYRAQVREDLAGLFGLLREGRITAQVARPLPPDRRGRRAALRGAGRQHRQGRARRRLVTARRPRGARRGSTSSCLAPTGLSGSASSAMSPARRSSRVGRRSTQSRASQRTAARSKRRSPCWAISTQMRRASVRSITGSSTAAARTPARSPRARQRRNHA